MLVNARVRGKLDTESSSAGLLGMATAATPSVVKPPVPVPSATTAGNGSFLSDIHITLNVMIAIVFWVGVQGLIDTIAAKELPLVGHRYTMYGAITAFALLLVIVLSAAGANPLHT